MGKYKTFGSLFNRIYRNDLNQNFIDIEADINAQKSRVDTIVASAGNSNTEIVDARGTYPVLRDRLTATETSLAQKADKTEVTVKADKVYVDTQVQAVATGSPKGVYTTLPQLQSAFPTGNSNVYLVTGNVKEIETLNITAAPTTIGNVSVTLNGVATNVAVTSGVKEVASLTISAIPTTAGNITVTLNGVAINIAVDPATETTTDLVATKIRNTVFTGWVTGGTSSTVTFTASAVGVKTDATYSAGSTGATGTMSTTTQGVDADTATTVATKIRGTSFSSWTTGGTGTTITFTKTTAGTNTAPSYSAGSTGATGTMSVTTAGVNVDGNWYFWNGSAWTAGGVYQGVDWAEGVNARTDTVGNTFTTVKNRIDNIENIIFRNGLSSVVPSAWKRATLDSNGAEAASSWHIVTTNFQDLLGYDEITLSCAANYQAKYAWYDENFVYKGITASWYTNPTTIKTQGYRYAKFLIASSVGVQVTSTSESSNLTITGTYRYTLPVKNIADDSLTVAKNKNNKIPLNTYTWKTETIYNGNITASTNTITCETYLPVFKGSILRGFNPSYKYKWNVYDFNKAWNQVEAQWNTFQSTDDYTFDFDGLIRISISINVGTAFPSDTSVMYNPLILISSNEKIYTNTRIDEVNNKIANLDLVTLPAYFANEVTDTVNKLYNSITSKALVFTIVTDSHAVATNDYHEQCMKNVNEVQKEFPSDFIAHLGDIIDGYSGSAVDVPLMKDYVKQFRNINENAFFLLGNHDDESYSTTFTNDPITNFDVIDDMEAYSITQRFNDIKVTRNNANINYYVDFPKFNVRCIFMKSVRNDADNTQFGTGQYYWGYTQNTVDWLTNEALATPDNYKVIVFSHCPTNATLGGTNGTYRNGNLVETALGNYDAQPGKQVLAFIYGHIHVTSTKTISGYNFPFIGCENALPVASANASLGTVNTRTIGTVTQDCWDTFVYLPDENKLKITRFGAGTDREVNLS